MHPPSAHICEWFVSKKNKKSLHIIQLELLVDILLWPRLTHIFVHLTQPQPVAQADNCSRHNLQY